MIDKNIPTKRIVHKTMHPAPFQISTRKTTNQHDFKLTMDCGVIPGPWIVIGVNTKLYGLGYLPRKHRRT